MKEKEKSKKKHFLFFDCLSGRNDSLFFASSRMRHVKRSIFKLEKI